MTREILFKREQRFTAPSKVGELEFDGILPCDWADNGMQHTKRNQRKIVRHQRFYEGIA